VIPTLDVKYAYSMCLGMLVALTGVSVWQRLSPPPTREISENLEASKVIVPPLPTTFTRPSLNDGENIGSLRVGNRTDRSVRIVLFHELLLKMFGKRSNLSIGTLRLMKAVKKACCYLYQITKLRSVKVT